MKNHNSFGRNIKPTFWGDVGGVGCGGVNGPWRAGMLRNSGRARLLIGCNVIHESL